MLRSAQVRLAAVTAALTLSLGVAAGPAAAQPQEGLVNVNVENNTVQVPIAIAANVCGLQVGVLAQGLVQGPVNCTAVADATATRAPGGGGGGGGPQTGLVNLNISDNVIQVPIGVAANVCGVQAGVLATALLQAPVTCDAQGNATADA